MKTFIEDRWLLAWCFWITKLPGPFVEIKVAFVSMQGCKFDELLFIL